MSSARAVPRALRSRSRLSVAGGAAVALLLSGLGAADAGAADNGPACAASAATLVDAGAMAASCGTPVDVSGLMDPWSSTTANADGTVTWTSNIEAVRSQRADGSWVAVDRSFTAAKAGRIGLAAPAVSMSFSDGTAGQPLAVLTKDGQTMTYGMPFALPAPQVDAADGQLVYPGVLSGVDLIVTVNPDGSGFSEVLRIADKAALDQPALKGLTLPVALSDGLSWHKQANGDLQALDATGKAVFVAPNPIAWDSSAGAAASATPSSSGGISPFSASLSATELAPMLNGADLPDPTQAPADGDTVAPLGVTVTGDGDDLGLSLDQGLVDSAQFPLYVDPSVSGSLQGQAYVQSAYPTTAHFNDSAVTSYPVGDCTSAIGCSPANLNRSFFQWTGLDAVGAVDGADVQSATFTVHGYWSYDCTATPVSVVHTGGISSGTTWNAQPGVISTEATVSLAHKSGCASPNDERDVAFSVLGAAQYNATNNGTQLTLGMFAGDEASVTGWKRYQNPRIAISYNRLPKAPTDMTTTPATTCTTTGTLPVINDTTPTYSWKETDPDGGNVYDNLDVVDVAAGAIYWDADERTAVTSGGTFTLTQPSDKPLLDGHTYEWRPGGKDFSARTAGVYGPQAACRFKVDTSPPGAPVVSSTDFPQDQVAAASIGIGSSGKFTLTPAKGDTDVVSYAYSFNSDALNKSVSYVAGGTSVPFTVGVDGSQRLEVQAVDAAGNKTGTPTVYRFIVTLPTPEAVWHLNEASGASAADGSQFGGHTLTLSSSLAGTRGPGAWSAFGVADDHALTFAQSTDTASTAKPVVDTSRGFAVSAFLNPDASMTSGVHVAVSQDGQSASGFKFGLDTSGCPNLMSVCYAFWRDHVDATGTSNTPVTAAVPVNPGQWTQLVAVYQGGQESLYVCDQNSGAPVLQGTAAAGASWASTGGIQLGHGKNNGLAMGYWVGGIDDVRLYASAIDDAAIRRICQGNAS